jgi:hypothetical protein
MDGVVSARSSMREAEAAARNDRLRAAQLAALHRIAPSGIVGALITAYILGGVLIRFGVTSVPILASWEVCLTAVAAIHLLHLPRLSARPPSRW